MSFVVLTTNLMKKLRLRKIRCFAKVTQLVGGESLSPHGLGIQKEILTSGVVLFTTIRTGVSLPSHPRTSLALPRFPLSPSPVHTLSCCGLGPGLPVMGHCPCPAGTRRAQLALVNYFVQICRDSRML